MSPELLFQKICVAILILSFIPGFIWGWKETHNEGTFGRLCLAFLTSFLPPCILVCLGFILAMFYKAIEFVFT